MAAEGELFTLTFTVPGAPRGKRAPQAANIGGHAMMFTDAKTRSELGAIKMFAAEAMKGQKPYDGAVILRLCAYRPIPASLSKKKTAAALAGEIAPTTKPDLDNYYKMVDALNKVVWIDDAQIVTAVVHKRYSDQPRLVIDVRSTSGGPA